MTTATPVAGESLRVLVAGVSWPLETFVERLLIGLASDGLQLVIRSRHRPPTSWLERTGIAWEHGGGQLDRAALVAQLRNNGLPDAVRAAAAGGASQLSRRGHASRPGPDVIYVPWLNALMAEPALFDLGAPVVTSCRGALVTIAPWDPGRPDYQEQLERVFDRSTLVHCVSDDIFAEATALGLEPSKGRVIHPAVSPELFRPTGRTGHTGGPTRVVAVGSLIWRKDYEHAFVAMRQAIDAGADLTFELIGDGPDAQHLRYTIDDLDLTDRARLLGRLSPEQVAVVLRDADVFLHSSSAEGLSNAVLEAMATGLAVVTTDAGGMSEAVRDGLDGFVVPVRRTTQMAAALRALAADRDLRERLGRSGRERVLAHFTLDQQVRDFRDLLDAAASMGASA